MDQLSLTSNSDQKLPIKPIHFRPIRYEVQAEVDKLFGLTQMQQRQLALRHRDEDGKLWFDGLEQEEFRHLLQPRSIPSSPMSPIDYDISRRSSTAAGMSNSVPSSPLNPFFAPSGHSFENGFARRRSSISSNLLLQFDDSGIFQRRKSVSFSPLTAMLERGGANLQSDVSVHPTEQQAKTVQPLPIYKRRRNKRSRSDDDNHVQCRNKVSTQRLTAEEEENPFENGANSKTEDRQQKIEKKIIMPNFLPIPRHQLDGEMLEEAFGPKQKSSKDKTDGDSIITNILKRQSPSSSARSSSSPTTMQQDATSSVLDTSKFEKRFKEMENNESTNSILQIDNNDDHLKQGEGRRNTTFISADNPKAAAMLGMTAKNEKLLVPGGLGTGEHVYDGIEIPCASVRLQSDDEGEDDDDNDENVKNTSRGLRIKFDRQKNRMKRVLQ